MIYWLVFSGILLYMEVVFHFGCFGLEGVNPILTLGLIALVGAVQALIVGSLRKKGQRIAFWLLLIPEYLVFAVQTVYFKIFRQPLQLGAAIVGGQDALTNYWREALQGILLSLPLLVLLALPLIVLPVMWRRHHRRRWPTSPVRSIQLRGIDKLRLGLGAWLALTYCICSVMIGDVLEADYSEDYIEYYDPDSVMRKMGVLVMVQRDGWYEIRNLADGIFDREEKEPLVNGGTVASAQSPPTVGGIEPEELQPETSGSGEQGESGQESEETLPPEPEEPEIDTSPNVWQLDLAKLAELSQDNKQTKWLSNYIANLVPTNRNEYTGMFEGYNLIYLTAEGFSTYAIREDLTPTLYKMVNSGFVFTNYYVPLWQTSTSDGEYVNCTGLIPDGQFSMRKSASNSMLYSLPRFFDTEGVYSRAYHNNTLSYYDRHRTHPNLGYDFKAAKLGNLSSSEWGDKIFPMEHPKSWPASDYEMMQGTLPEYVGDDRFHVYYMTISGHMYYTFSGNRMSSKNKEAVANLDMSENARAYIACNIELDKAMGYLIEQLELAGKLDNTVICLSADHYPYCMTEEEYEELAGKDLSQDLDLFRNSLILWNAAMEEPVVVDKACCSVDILPTLLNLFGFDYDSRMYAGRDIFSDGEGLVIFNDKSFVTDTVAYNKKKKTKTWLVDMTEEEQETYMELKKQDVKDRYNFSAYILRNDYYSIIEKCRVNQNVPEEPSAGAGDAQ